MIEKTIDAFMPSNFHRFELAVLPYHFAMNKLIYNPSNQKYQEDYVTKKQAFLDDNATHKKKINRVDLSLDMIVALFVVATLILLKVVCPFPDKYY